MYHAKVKIALSLKQAFMETQFKLPISYLFVRPLYRRGGIN